MKMAHDKRKAIVTLGQLFTSCCTPARVAATAPSDPLRPGSLRQLPCARVWYARLTRGRKRPGMVCMSYLTYTKHNGRASSVAPHVPNARVGYWTAYQMYQTRG
ncbi:unnamed protein product [Scytosiphon promiscuus]